MRCVLYKNKSEKNRVGKILTGASEKTIHLKDDSNLISPTISISTNMESISGFNYFYIPDFKRYYFITDARSRTAGMVEITGHVDVLESFKDEIRNLHAYVLKSESSHNLYVDDGTYPLVNKDSFKCITFPYEFNKNPSYVMAIAASK